MVVDVVVVVVVGGKLFFVLTSTPSNKDSPWTFFSIPRAFDVFLRQINRQLANSGYMSTYVHKLTVDTNETN